MFTPRSFFAKFAFLTACMLAGALLVAACGGDDPGLNEVADIQRPASTDAATASGDDGLAEAAGSGDTSTISDGDGTDEESEGSGAAEAGDSPPAPTPIPTVGTYATMADFIGSGDAITLSRGFTGCADDFPAGAIETNDEHIAAIIAAMPDASASTALTTALGHIDEADAACGTDAATWASGMRRALGELEQVEATLGTRPESALDVGVHPDDAADLRHVSTDLASMNDRLYAALSGRNPIQASNVWFASGHLAHARGLHALTIAGAPAEAVLLGDSTAAYLAPPEALSEQVGFTVANLGIDGSRLGTQIAIIDQVLELSPETRTVIWPLTTLMFFRSCPDGADTAVDNIAVQRAAFAPIPELAALPPIERLLGGSDPAGPIYGGTTINEDATKRYPNGWVYGTRQIIDLVSNPEAEQNQRNRWTSTFDNPQVCDSEFAALEAKARQLRESGRRVVLIAGPLSNDLTDIHPDGRPAHQEVVTRMAQTAAAADVEFIDLSDTIGEDQFRDLTHVNLQGAETSVALLADALVVPT